MMFDISQIIALANRATGNRAPPVAVFCCLLLLHRTKEAFACGEGTLVPPPTPGSNTGGAKTRVRLQGAHVATRHDSQQRAGQGSSSPVLSGLFGRDDLRAQAIEVILAIKAISCREEGAKSCSLLPAEKSLGFSLPQ